MTCHLPDDLIVLISGVPGAGKTTISYELLKIHTEIRLIEETDIIRDILRGYNIYLKETCNFEFDKVCSHDIFLTYDMAKEQCKIMKESILNIIKRQQRKKNSYYNQWRTYYSRGIIFMHAISKYSLY